MADLFVSNVDDATLKRFYKRIGMLNPTGKPKKGDVRKHVTEALRFWLDHGSGE